MNPLFPIRRTAACFLTLSMLATSAFAASDYLLEIDGVKGESRKKAGAIDFVGFSYEVVSPRDVATGQASGRRSVASPADDGTSTAEAAAVTDIVCKGSVSIASPQLALACAKGTHFPKATITCRKAGDKPETYMVITLQEVMVSSYSQTGDSSQDSPAESFSLNFASASYLQRAPGGGDPSEILVKFVVKK